MKPKETYFSPVAEFFKDKNVFMTGATGFLGKVLLEKLLRCCTGVKTIYVLMRGKDGQDPRQRLDELLSTQVFNNVRDHPGLITKVVPINGDITLPGLGISQSDQQMLMANISVIFHSAATIRFDEPLKKAVEINLKGTKSVIELANKMPNLKALVHVSTAYSNCHRDEVEEVFYPEEVSPQKIINLTEWMDEDLLNRVTPQVLKGRPTTYHYTKALTENYIMETCGNMPVAVVRPSIISAAWKEPLPGYLDSMTGPAAFFVATGKGVLRTMIGHKDSVLDLYPVDCCVNLLISVAWYLGTQSPSTIPVYNCTSGSVCSLTWGDMQAISYPYLIKYPSQELFRYPGGKFRTNRVVNEIVKFYDHNVPGYLADFFGTLVGCNPGLVAVYKRIHRALGFLEFFTTHQWNFHNENMYALLDLMNPVDREVFCFDVKNVPWSQYIENYVLGVRQYVLKEDLSTLPAARTKLKRLYYAGQLVRLLTIIGTFQLMMRSKSVKKYWWNMISWSVDTFTRMAV